MTRTERERRRRLLRQRIRDVVVERRITIMLPDSTDTESEPSSTRRETGSLASTRRPG